MKATFVLRSVGGPLLVAAFFAGAGEVSAQTPTGTIRGTVGDENGQPLAGASVVARNAATNFQRGMLTEETGFYNLGGLPPGPYEVEFSHPSYGAQSQNVRVQIGQTQKLDVALFTDAIEVEGISAVVERERIIELETPEVATNITQAQIENLPQLNRNFLDFAKLAPGLIPSADGNGVSAGGVDAENVNLFIDGASYKNNVLRNGIVGQDASDGNPFPQNAVEEFRVITQNYKAEYQRATGAVITATTKSGTNEWEGSAFFLGQNEDFIGKDPFQACDAPGQSAECVDQDPRDIGRQQFGGTLGGPIVRDRVFFFGSYEGNYRDLSETIRTVPSSDIALLPADVAAEVQAISGRSFTRPLRSDLFFGKVTHQGGERNRFEASLNIRDEFEERGFGDFNAKSRAEDFNNDVFTLIGRWTYSVDRLLNEAHVDFQRFHWNPLPLNPGEVARNYQGIINLGGNTTEQDFEQDGITLRDDLTYTIPDWNGSHVFKGGVFATFYNYDVTKFQLGNPEFQFRQAEGFEFPFEARVGLGDPNISHDNTQYGLYVQDDWEVNDRLILNLGLRWDVETNMLNDEWVTPDSVREEIAQFLTPEQEAKYFTDGDDRDDYLGALAPRIGFSYDLTGNNTTSLFGGFGIFYDRHHFNIGLDEQFRLKFPVFIFRFSEDGTADPAGNPTVAWEDRFLSRQGLLDILTAGTLTGKPEVFLLDNETRPPKAHQYTIGVRQAIGDMVLSANYTGVRGFNEFTWLFGNRRPENNSCCLSTDRFGNLLLSDDSGKTWYDALLLQLGRPFTAESGWGTQLSYTLSEAEQENFGDFTLDVLTPDNFQRHPSSTDERHRFVANGVVALPWDFHVSGILTLASARPISAFIGNDPNNDGLFNDFPEGETRNSRRPEEGEFEQFDLRLDKAFLFGGGQQIQLIAEVFNVFDSDNFACFTDFFGNFNRDTQRIEENPVYGNPNCVTGISDATSRRLQLGAKYGF